MELQFAFLAESATVPPDRKFYVLGGGFSAVALASFPARIGFAAVSGWRVTGSDAGQRHELEARFVDSAGGLVVPKVPMLFQFPPEAPPPEREVIVPAVTFFSPMISEKGGYQVQYWFGGTQVGSVGLYIDEQPAVTT